jgi:hypothetical protein
LKTDIGVSKINTASTFGSEDEGSMFPELLICFYKLIWRYNPADEKGLVRFQLFTAASVVMSPVMFHREVW